MKLRLILSISLLVALLSQANAQSEAVRKSANYSGETTENILNAMSDLYQVDIYFPEGDTELKRTQTKSYADVTLQEMLADVLSETTYGFIPYRDYAFVIAPRLLIEEEYSADFYKVLEGPKTKKNLDEIGSIATLSPSGVAKITGVITDAQNGEPVIGATINIKELSKGTVTDIDGSYEIDAPAGVYELQMSYIGYADKLVKVNVLGNGAFDVALDKGAILLNEVTISAQAANASVERAQIGVESIDMEEVKKLPSFLGEVDVVKSFLLQPGVSSIGEGASGFNVRGGDVDQNLILQDAGFLFNSSHALGFFSTFNSELIRKVDLYKGNIPAQYGGRLASAMNVEMRDGNFEAFKIKGGVGPVSSRLVIEGPIVSDKVSFIAGGRASYTDWIINQVKNIEVRRSSAFFYDANARLTIKPNEKNTITLSAYASDDEFFFNEEFGFDYSTKLAELSYKTILGTKLFSKLSATVSKFESVQFDLDGIDASSLANNVGYIKVREELRYVPDDQLEIVGGVQAIKYDVDPGTTAPLDENSLAVPRALDKEKGLESAAFVNAEYNFSDALSVSGGVRFNLFQLNGPRNVFTYQNPDRPITEEITGSSIVDGTIATYSSIEPRFSLRYKLSDDVSIKTGYSRTSQFISQIFNSDSPTPTSQWQLSTDYIEPLKSHNVSIGYFQNFDNNNWETSFEIYGRKIDQLFDFRDFADLTVNEHLETELLDGEGRSYGAEMSIKKKEGALSGWFSYTYSRSERLIDGINNNTWYPSSFDKPHDLSLVLNYNPNKRNTFTVNFNYGTGRPTTAPTGTYVTDTGIFVPVYAQRNSLRIPDYIRMDLAYTIGQGYKVNRKFKTSWTISLYNVLGRQNAFSVFFTQGAFQSAQANKLAVLGTVFPSLTLNFELL